MRGALAVLSEGLALSGCAGGSRPEKPPTELELLQRSAQLAFSRRHYAQASTLYQAALDQALIADDPQAIIDARFNLALAQTYLGRHQPALDLVQLAEAERVRRHLGPDPELELLRATIHYRAGELVLAHDVLARLLAGNAVAADTAARTHFLAGIIAAERADASTVRLHRNALPAGESSGEQADRLELDGRLAAIGGDREAALRFLDRTALVRSQDGDYRGMVRALAAAGRVAEDAGRPEQAAGYWLRAGRSGAQGGEAEARGWLEHARALGKRTGDAALVLEAEALLARLETTQQAK
jgi:tetratricopeptide (TPR) repeat protein